MEFEPIFPSASGPLMEKFLLLGFEWKAYKLCERTERIFTNLEIGEVIVKEILYVEEDCSERRGEARSWKGMGCTRLLWGRRGRLSAHALPAPY